MAALATMSNDPWSSAGYSLLSSAAADGSAFGRDAVMYFGPPDGRPLGGPGRDRWTDHYTLPEIWRNGTVDNRYLGTVVEGLAATGLGFLNTVFAPMEYSNDVEFKWNVWVYNQSNINRSGHEQVPRMVTKGKKAFSAKSQMHTIGLQWEAFFLDSKEGILDFALSILQLRRMIQMTHANEALYAMLTCNTQEEAWEAANGYTKGMPPMERMQREIERTFGVQKRSVMFLAETIDELSQHAEADGGWKYNMLVLPPGVRAHFAFADPMAVFYQFRSPGGRSLLLEGPAALGSVQGLNVYEAPITKRGSLAENANLMTTTLHVGHFVVMSDPWLRNGGVRKRTPADRDTRKYNEPRDQWGTFSIADALRNCHRHKENGELRDEHQDLARDKVADPLVWFTTSGGEGRVAHFWGQCRPEPRGGTPQPGMYLTDDHLAAVARSFAEPFSEADRADLEGGLALLRRLAANTAAPWAVAGATLATFRGARGDAREWVWDNVIVTGAPGAASWLGLELYAERGAGDDRAAAQRCMAVVRRLYERARQSFGEGSLVVDPARAPAHLAPFVNEPGPCTLFERAIHREPSVPVFLVAAGPGAADPFGLAALGAAAEADRVAFINARAAAVRADAGGGAAEQLFDNLLAFLDARAQAKREEGPPSLAGASAATATALTNGYATLTRAPIVFAAAAGVAAATAGKLEAFLAAVAKGLATAPGAPAPDLADSAQWPAVADGDVIQALMDGVTALPMGDARAALTAFLGNRTVSAGAPATVAEAYVATPLVATRASPPFTAANAAALRFRPGSAALGFAAPAGDLAVDTKVFEAVRAALRVPRRYSPEAPAAARDARSVRTGAGAGVAGAAGAPAPDGRPLVAADAVGRDVDVRTLAFDDPLHFSASPGFLKRYKDVMEMDDPMARAGAAAFIFGRTDRAGMAALAGSTVAIPFGFLIVNPWCAYRADAIIVAKGGPETAKTVFGRSKFMVSQNAQDMTLMAHLAYYARVLIFQPKYVTVVDAAMCRQALGGAGMTFYTTKQLQDRALAEFRGIKPQHTGPAAIALFVFSDYQPPAPVIDVTGRFRHAQDASANVPAGSDTAVDHYPSAGYYNRVLRLTRLSPSRLGYAAFGRRNRVNSVVVQTYQAFRNPATQEFDVERTESQDHFGPDVVGPGALAIRNGRPRPPPGEGLPIRRARAW